MEFEPSLIDKSASSADGSDEELATEAGGSDELEAIVTKQRKRKRERERERDERDETGMVTKRGMRKINDSCVKTTQKTI